MNFGISDIKIDSPQTIEQLGTKEKFWIFDKNSRTYKLFKIGRIGTGENWSEKVACELAKLMGLPCAEYDFAKYGEKQGVLSPLFVPDKFRLILGNEILVKIEKDYSFNKFYKVRGYTLLAVLAIVKSVPDELPPGYTKNDSIRIPLDLFLGYLLFDCWISNPDRHHENWGFMIDNKKKKIYLAPTFDHASGLGCRVSDTERKERLTTNDLRYNVDAFVKKTKSAFNEKGKKGLVRLKTIDAFAFAARFNHNKKAEVFWLNKLKSVSQAEIEKVFNSIPSHLISEVAKKFALKILESNKNRLLKMQN